MKTLNACFAAVLLFVFVPHLHAEQDNNMLVDGLINESSWQSAQSFYLDKVVEPFTLRSPSTSTQVKIFSNPDGIYVGVVSEQTKTKQTSVRTARDQEIESDFIRLILDFDQGKTTAYQFTLGNGGSMQDGIWRDENSFKTDWDGNWQGKTSQTDSHWVAEFFIPWTVAPMAKVSGEQRQMGLFIDRHHVHNAENYSFAELNNDQQRFLSVLPEFSVTNFQANSLDIFASATYQKDLLTKQQEANLSLELFWRPDPSQQLSVAINPDFGQVESDDLVVNFSPFETFFAERRPFFTENQGLFDVTGNAGLRLVHTRRMGAEAGIDAAIKHTFNGESNDLGVIAVFEDSQLNNAKNQFYIGRIKHRLAKSQLGYLITYADKPAEQRKSHVHAIDLRHNLSSSIQIEGQLFASFIDLPLLKNSDGLGGSVNFLQEFNDDWRHRLHLTYLNDQLAVNDLGFLERADLKRVFYANEFYLREFEQGSKFQEKWFEFNSRIDYNQDGERIDMRAALFSEFKFTDTSFLFWYVRHYFTSYDDALSRGMGSVKLEDGNQIFAEYNFGNQGQFRHHIALGLYNRDDQGRGTDFHYHPSYYFTDNYRVEYSLWTTRTEDRLLWVDGQLNRYDYTSINNSVNFDATIADNQELRIKFQWVAVRAVRGTGFNLMPNGDLVANNTNVDDFAFSNTALQIRYRYELSPLSNIFLVYSRGGFSEQYESGESPWQLFSNGWDNRNADNFVAKIRYRF